MKKPRLLLVVDTMNLVLRAYYAPVHVAVALEGSGPSFREELFPEYLATRKRAPRLAGPRKGAV